MKTLVLNDLHLGVKRQAGTTKKSREALESWMLDQFEECLKTPHDNLIILGDLFHQRNVEEHVMARVITALGKERECVIVAGNHDLGGIEDHTISSAEFVVKMADAWWADTPQKFGDSWVIPHLHSQDEFDKAVQECPDDTILMVHCNIDSPFAHGDHSLNLSLQQMKDLSDRGVDVIAGHEHTKRDVMNVTILGNQFPSSISDCMGGDKYLHILEDNELTEICTWEQDDSYNDEGTFRDHGEFINITGECELSEYPGIVESVADLRKLSDAFIVKNSVKVREFEADTSAEEITRFNITEMLLEEINPDFREEVKQCT